MGLPIHPLYVDPWERALRLGRPDPAIDLGLQDSGVSILLKVWRSTVLAGAGGLSLFLRSFCEDRLPRSSQRWRDILPLPRPRVRDLIGWEPSVDITIAHSLLEVVCGCLNFLFFGGAGCAVPSASTQLHRCFFRRIQGKLSDMFSELDGEDRSLSIAGSFDRLTSKTDKTRFPDLRADDVDHIERAGVIDPLPFVPDDLQRRFQSPSLLFPNGIAHVGSRRACRDEHRGDYVTLTIALLRTGKLRLHRSVRASADVFCVDKADSSTR